MLTLTLASAPVHAATFFENASTKAEINGHNVFSRFLPGAFLVLPENAPGGSNPQVDPAPAPIDVTSLVSQPAGPPSLVSNELPGSSDSGNGPISGGPTPALSTVPLPPALPMFGAAVLAVAAFGAARRQRTASRAA